MRTRSKQLWKYLSDSGVLNGNEADIYEAKIRYRKEYKRRWKMDRKRYPHKSVRVLFSLREYHELKYTAICAGTNPTAYIKNLTLQSLNGTLPIQPDVIKEVLALIGKGINKCALVPNDLLDAERMLMKLFKVNQNDF